MISFNLQGKNQLLSTVELTCLHRCYEWVTDHWFTVYTAVSVWLELAGLDWTATVVLPLLPATVTLGSSAATQLLEMMEERLPRLACRWSTRWIFWLLAACWICELSTPCRNALTTRIWVCSLVRPRIQRICPDLDWIGLCESLWEEWWPA